jgi:hypothetical protein
MLLPNGEMIKNDVIESFNAAVSNPENRLSGKIDWDWVSADMAMDLDGVYNFNYIDECFEVLADNYLI